MKIKNLNKKGFTLIELLAVIVILAIVLVIAVPSVLNIQKNAKQGTTKDEALMLVKSIELCILGEQDVCKCASDDTRAGSCKAGDKTKIGDYYEKVDLLTKGDASYELSGTTVEDIKISNFKFVSNGYAVVSSSSLCPTSGVSKCSKLDFNIYNISRLKGAIETAEY